MFYRNHKPLKSVVSAKVNFTNFEKTMNTEIDEALLPYKTAKISYNFNVKNGALTNGYGFSELTLPKISEDGFRKILPPDETIKKIWLYKYYNQEYKVYDPELIIYCESGNIYFAPIYSDAPFCGTLMNDIFSSSVPNAINYRLNSEDVLLFSSESEGMWKYCHNNKMEKVENSPFIRSMCLHYERMFAVAGKERNRLAFSANLDPTDWSEDLSTGGFIDMQDERGALNKVISFNDYVYVFRDNGVSRVSGYGDQTEFNVSHLFISSVKLYGETVTVCGNKILLLAKDGIHSFDGYSTKKLNLGIDSLFEGVSNECANGLYYNNKYYLACRLNFNDGEKIGCENYEGGYKNNALIELDLSTNEISITRGVDIASMVVLEGENFSKVAVCFNGEHSKKIGELNKSGCVFGQALSKKWVSPKSNMGYPTKVKQIKECFIKTKGPCKIKICTDKQTKEFNVMPKEVSQRIKLGMTGEQIEVSFMSDYLGETLISCPQIVLDIEG